MSVSSNLKKLLAALPAIILLTVINVLITFVVSGVALIEFAASGHKYVGLGVAILTAVGVYSWLVFNHKLRDYIRALETQNDE